MVGQLKVNVFGSVPTPQEEPRFRFMGSIFTTMPAFKIFPYLKADQFNTIDVLKHLRTEFPERDITLIWDGAPYHRAQLVKEALDVLQINLEPLPGYSPDFMPVEHLWQWLREDVTYHTCYQSPTELIERVHLFEQDINSNPFDISDCAPRSAPWAIAYG
ncbi:transposase [Kalymmatonema gypsitolerans NIES-4073]|nr:transposase [Scytonema sp. NIES-4073]